MAIPRGENGDESDSIPVATSDESENFGPGEPDFTTGTETGSERPRVKEPQRNADARAGEAMMFV